MVATEAAATVVEAKGVAARGRCKCQCSDQRCLELGLKRMFCRVYRRSINNSAGHRHCRNCRHETKGNKVEFPPQERTDKESQFLRCSPRKTIFPSVTFHRSASLRRKAIASKLGVISAVTSDNTLTVNAIVLNVCS